MRADNARIPPSPLLSSLRIMKRNFTDTTSNRDQTTKDAAPVRFRGLICAAWGPAKHSRNAYSGLVPISPKTIPNAAMVVAASFGVRPVGPKEDELIVAESNSARRSKQFAGHLASAEL